MKSEIEKWLERFDNDKKPNVFEISIDRLTLLGNWTYKGPDKFQKLLDNYKYDIRITKGNKTRTPSGFIFYDKCFFEIIDKLKFKDARSFRLDFNPNKLTAKEIQFLKRKILPLLSDVSATRIDLAFDIELNLEEYQFIEDNHPRKRMYIRGRGLELQTLNIGSQESDYRVTIYNKLLERKAKLSMNPEEVSREEENLLETKKNWWRVEFKLEGQAALVETNLNAFSEYNVFRGLKIYKPNYKAVDDIRTRAMMFYLINHENEWGNLTWESKKKYKECFEAFSEYDLVDYLKDRYLLKREKLEAQYMDYILSDSSKIR
ncbi:hypothetical protein BSK49_15905 [Paenibacillus odorifer]|uniref:hypothetical protein n=1 Tax=Paenibacillus TaxID=44249 RepID=UPI00096E2E16|nr:hypothetical protein [Paenibacillus odorifer]OMD88142.1 hypothetical protein BSK49_15905 [Paenibacillus odorifer]